MPDSAETRLGIVERQVAKLEQAKDDLLDRLNERFKTFDDDVRAFAPLLKDIVEIQRDLKYIHEAIADNRGSVAALDKRVTDAIRDLIARLEAAAGTLTERLDEEEHAREVRIKGERRDKWMRIATTVALVGTFISSTTAVLALLLG
jgi:DNA repair exonuclease SbcCD ATPase subunit